MDRETEELGRIDRRLGHLTHLQERLFEVFAQNLQRAESEGHLEPAELERQLQVVSKLTVRTIEEGQRLENFRERIVGGAGAGGFDLGAARDEVCRRLARLRAARADGALSGGAE
jgi:CRP-like cAMP-binding protein